MKNNINIRDLHISDFFKLHEMYDSLDMKKTRPFFNLYWLGLKQITPKWFLVQFPLFFSTIKFIRKILYKIYPYIIFLSKVAVDKNKIISFGFLIIRKKYKNDFSAELGVAVIDEMQGKGLGSEIVGELIKSAKKEPIGEIYLTTRVENIKAHSMYKKFGFKDISILKDEVEWLGIKYNMYKMHLILN